MTWTWCRCACSWSARRSADRPLGLSTAASWWVLRFPFPAAAPGMPICIRTCSPLQGGLPTDRLVAEWWLKSKRVVDLLDKKQPPQFQVEKRIGVPAQIYAWKSSPDDRQKAADVQKRNREQFLPAFSQGLVAL